MTIQEAIRSVTSGSCLSTGETRSVFNQIMGGEATDAQIAAFIVALRMKGETVDEITGAAEVMREKATPVLPENTEHVVDTCGTGGDRSNTFNISTATAFVAAGAGATVAKHGNRSVSSKSGSADVIEALGVNITVTPETMKKCLDDIGICFLFAPSLHKAMKHAIGPRKEIAIRTVFNILGPLTNPSRAANQLLGVFSPDMTEPLAKVLANMGSAHAYVVHGLDGLDEITLSGRTRVSELANGSVNTYEISPHDFGIKTASTDAIAGKGPEENAEIIRAILAGTENGPCRDIVVLNAAFAIAASGIAKDPNEGAARAAEALDSGAASEKLSRLAEITTA